MSWATVNDGCPRQVGCVGFASGSKDASGRCDLRLLYHPIDDLAPLEIVFGQCREKSGRIVRCILDSRQEKATLMMLRKTSAQATLSLCCGGNIMKTTFTCFIVVGLAVVTLAYYAPRPAAQPVAPASAPAAAQPIAQDAARPTSKPQAGLPTAKGRARQPDLYGPRKRNGQAGRGRSGRRRLPA